MFWFHGILWELGAIKVTALWITILTWGFATQPCNAFNKSFLWFHLCSCSHTIWIYPYKYPFGGLILKGLGQVSSQVRPSIIDHLTVLFFWPATALLSERANSILRWDTEEWHGFFFAKLPKSMNHQTHVWWQTPNVCWWNPPSSGWQTRLFIILLVLRPHYITTISPLFAILFQLVLFSIFVVEIPIK